MLTNLHTHTSFCDGKSTPEEIVLFAIDKGFSSIGFSGHATTPFDLSYCMKDTEGYISEIKRVRDKYGRKIQIYLGIEEDMYSTVDRDRFDYIIGSSHYIFKDGKYYSVDSGTKYIQRCLEAFNSDVLALADSYYNSFCDYITERKPDIVGHFDLITKFDEALEVPLFLENKEYLALSEKYIRYAAKTPVIFEVNTGAMARGVRKTPYPYENLLFTLKKCDAKITLSSDSHSADTLDYCFKEASAMLRDIGFTHRYVLSDGKFVPDRL